MKALPNILTGLRLVLCLVNFLALLAIAGTIPGLPPLHGPVVGTVLAIAFWSFVVASVTDFFDGWLARKYNAVSVTGAILDPIADKVLVCGALIGLVAVGARDVALPAGLILFREFSVSALREVLAPRGLKLPVTFLAKTKTTLQLVALAMIMGIPLFAKYIPGADDLARLNTMRTFMLSAIILLWVATAVTVWTGIEYALAARKALKQAQA
jgi:CDP-diacylglycerol--glycerol-3-phosphate 3-phosphatidyltransferase